MWNDRPLRKMFRNSPNNIKKRSTTSRRINWVEGDDEKENTDDQEEEQNVLGIDEGGSPPFMMKGKINKKKCCSMIDSGSPVTINGYDELQKIIQNDVLLVRPLPKNKKYVNFNKRPVDLLGYIFCELEVGNKYIRKARILVSRPGKINHRGEIG